MVSLRGKTGTAITDKCVFFVWSTRALFPRGGYPLWGDSARAVGEDDRTTEGM